jgi:hypothetical protein
MTRSPLTHRIMPLEQVLGACLRASSGWNLHDQRQQRHIVGTERYSWHGLALRTPQNMLIARPSPSCRSLRRDTERAMSQENVEVFRRAGEAFNRTEVDAITDLLTEDFEFIPYLAAVVEKTTTYRRRDGLSSAPNRARVAARLRRVSSRRE